MTRKFLIVYNSLPGIEFKCFVESIWLEGAKLGSNSKKLLSLANAHQHYNYHLACILVQQWRIQKSEMTCFSLLKWMATSHVFFLVSMVDLWLRNLTLNLWFTIKVLPNGINSIGSSTCKNISFFPNIPTKITFPCIQDSLV